MISVISAFLVKLSFYENNILEFKVLEFNEYD